MLQSAAIVAIWVTGMGRFGIWIDVAWHLMGFVVARLLDIGIWNDIVCHPRGYTVALLLNNHQVGVCLWSMSWLYAHCVKLASLSGWIPHGVIGIHVAY